MIYNDAPEGIAFTMLVMLGLAVAATLMFISVIVREYYDYKRNKRKD
jgi:hypothetical protein